MGIVTDKFPDISFIKDAKVEEVLSRMINDYQDKYKEITGKEISLAKADPYRLIIYACALQIYQAMQYADRAGKMSFLKYAKGEYLDNLCALKGIHRIESKPAVTTLEFSIKQPLESAVSIPAGTRATNGNDLFFATDKYVQIEAGETSASVNATCTIAGTCGNGFEDGEINVMVNSLPYIVYVRNATRTTGGCDLESDDSLRDRAYNVPNSYSTAGPSGAYEYYVKQVDSGIDDVVIRSDTAGEVDILITANGGVPSEDLIKRVTEALNDRSIRPLTDNIKVKAPKQQAYDVSLTYFIGKEDQAAVSAIQSNVESAVKAYNKWQTKKIGRDINPSYLIQKIMEAGAKRVNINAPAFQMLENDTIAKAGDVTITYGGVEDD